MKWVIFIVGEHGTGKSSVAKELAARLKNLGIVTDLVEVSDVVQQWQMIEGNVADDAIYRTEKESVRLHRMLWDRIVSFSAMTLPTLQNAVIVSGARELHLLKSCYVFVRTASFGLLLSERERRKRFIAREARGGSTEEKARSKWIKSEKRSKELGTREVVLGCDTLVSLNLCQTVQDVVDVIMTGLLHSLWRNR